MTGSVSNLYNAWSGGNKIAVFAALPDSRFARAAAAGLGSVSSSANVMRPNSRVCLPRWSKKRISSRENSSTRNWGRRTNAWRNAPGISAANSLPHQAKNRPTIWVGLETNSAIKLPKIQSYKRLSALYDYITRYRKS